MSRPESYIELNCCPQCKHVFRRQDYDDEDEYYCTLGAEKRPRCGSGAMRGEFFDGNKTYKSYMNAWESWSTGKDVGTNGTCEKFESRNPK